MSSNYYNIIFFVVAINLFANELPDYNSNDSWIELQSGIEHIWVGYIETEYKLGLHFINLTF